MTIPDIDDVRSDRHADDLRKYLKKEVTHKSRVRHLFKRVEVPSEKFGDRRLAHTNDVGHHKFHLDRVKAGEEDRNDFERVMKDAPSRDEMKERGMELIDNMLQAEDCELIRALVRSEPYEIEVGDDEWRRLLDPGGKGGDPRQLPGRVLLYVRPDDPSDELNQFLSTQSVTPRRVNKEVGRWAARNHSRTIGFLAGPDPDGVKFEVEKDRDWRLVRQRDKEGLKLGVVATWRLAIEEEAVVHIVEPVSNPQSPATSTVGARSPQSTGPTQSAGPPRVGPPGTPDDEAGKRNMIGRLWADFRAAVAKRIGRDSGAEEPDATATTVNAVAEPATEQPATAVDAPEAGAEARLRGNGGPATVEGDDVETEGVGDDESRPSP